MSYFIELWTRKCELEQLLKEDIDNKDEVQKELDDLCSKYGWKLNNKDSTK